MIGTPGKAKVLANLLFRQDKFFADAEEVSV